MITYDENKRRRNLAKHGIDLAECEAVFDAPMHTSEDSSEPYGELRLQSIGCLQGQVVVMIWTPLNAGPRIISCRRAKRHETQTYYAATRL